MPMIVSKSLPSVAKVTVIFAGAVHVYHTEAPPSLPAIVGSPVSFVAPTLLPFIDPLTPTATCALAKLSFAGCAKATLPTETHAIAASTATVCRGAVQRQQI